MHRTVTAVLVGLAITVMLTLTGGCVTTGDPATDQVRRIVAVGAMIALDIDALQKDDATELEKTQFTEDVERAISLVGVDSNIGHDMAALLAQYVAGGDLQAPSWQSIVRMLLDWASTPGPAPTGPVSFTTPVVGTRHMIYGVLAARRYR